MRHCSPMIILLCHITNEKKDVYNVYMPPVVLIHCLWHTVVNLAWVSLFGELEEGEPSFLLPWAQTFSWRPWLIRLPIHVCRHILNGYSLQRCTLAYYHINNRKSLRQNLYACILLYFKGNYKVSFSKELRRVRAMVFNATFNNISITSWPSVLLVEETGLPGGKPLTCRKLLTNLII